MEAGSRLHVRFNMGDLGRPASRQLCEIKRSSGFLRHSTRVLAFANDGASLALKMNWVSASHLEVLFRDDPKVLYYQVVKTSGIEISVRNVSSPLSLAR